MVAHNNPDAKGQRSRSREAKVRFRELMVASFSSLRWSCCSSSVQWINIFSCSSGTCSRLCWLCFSWYKTWYDYCVVRSDTGSNTLQSVLVGHRKSIKTVEKHAPASSIGFLTVTLITKSDQIGPNRCKSDQIGDTHHQIWTLPTVTP